MKKQNILALLVFLSSPFTRSAHIEGIKLESESLKIADGTLIDWAIVGIMRKYASDVQLFMRKKYNVKNNSYCLIDLVRHEQAGTLTIDMQSLFDTVTADFIAFSEGFLETLRPVKAGLGELVEESCDKRNRNDSLLLEWSTTPNGQEHELFQRGITTFRSLCTFCIDLLYVIEDLIVSCPKAAAGYEKVTKRFHAIREHIDECLKNENRVLPHHNYVELIGYINTHYPQNTTDKEVSRSLYKKYMQQHFV